MKKLFISCPMKGRAEEAIKDSMHRMHKIAELTFGGWNTMCCRADRYI